MKIAALFVATLVASLAHAEEARIGFQLKIEGRSSGVSCTQARDDLRPLARDNYITYLTQKVSTGAGGCLAKIVYYGRPANVAAFLTAADEQLGANFVLSHWYIESITRQSTWGKAQDRDLCRSDRTYANFEAYVADLEEMETMWVDATSVLNYFHRHGDTTCETAFNEQFARGCVEDPRIQHATIMGQGQPEPAQAFTWQTLTYGYASVCP